MDTNIDIREVAMRFAEKISHEFGVDRLIFFGRRARGDPDARKLF